MRTLALLALAVATTTTPGVHAVTGGQFCATDLCVNALVQDTTVTYQLKSTLGFNTLGWMAVGFGSGMPNSPMVITWPNTDGTITLSQREASAHVMPTVVSNPSQVANLAWENSILATNTTTIAFTLPLPTNGPLNAVPMIWAYSNIRPPSAAADATLQQHEDMGTVTMDLTQSIDALPTGTLVTTVVGTSTKIIAATPTGTSSGLGHTTNGNGGSSSSSANVDTDLPLSPEEKKIRTHGILMSIGLLVLLPLGVFVARFSRTVPFLKDKWFMAHWVIQFVFSGPLIFAGWALGYQFVSASGTGNFWDTHTRVGLVVLLLYLIQLVWGTVIHFFKPKPKPLPAIYSDAEMLAPSARATATTHDPTPPTSSTALPVGSHPAAHSKFNMATALSPTSPYSLAIVARPLQNYGHALNGLTIIGLAFYNAHEGYDHEWYKIFGISRSQSAFLRSLNAWWVSWVVIIPVVYVLGLTFLPRQWKQETEARRRLQQLVPMEG